jgi:ABC-2 type transport system ATP-binding protein
MITTTALTKSYRQKPVVRDVSLRCEPGTITGFLGANGAGKSTTLKMIVGLVRPDRGTATIDGRPFVELPNPTRVVGMLLDASAMHAGRSGRATLTIAARLAGVHTRRVEHLLDLVGIADAAEKRVGTYSLGMRQRLGVAEALVGEPGALILDEPANGLDPQGIQWIRELLKGFAATGRSVFVSSHLLSEMALMADQLVVIGRGRLIASGPVEDFVSMSTRNAVIVRSPQATELADVLQREGAVVEPVQPDVVSVTGLDAARIGDLAFEHSIRLHELSNRVATLEEAFLEATAGAEEYQARQIAELTEVSRPTGGERA